MPGMESREGKPICARKLHETGRMILLWPKYRLHLFLLACHSGGILFGAEHQLQCLKKSPTKMHS